MTDKFGSWHFTGHAGMWWAFTGDPPPPDAFKTHQRPRDSRIIGPFPTRAIAEALLAQRLAKADKRPRASHRGLTTKGAGAESDAAPPTEATSNLPRRSSA